MGIRHSQHILAAFAAQPVGDDLLHRHLYIQVEETVPQASLQTCIGVGRQQGARAGIVLFEVLDDDAGFRDRLPACTVVQHRNLAHRPQVMQLGGRRGIGEVDALAGEGRVVFVQRNQNLVAE
ncbi:hypothetical protein D3C87_1853500 [compost metagenome]